jgi:hypothetical protein
MERQGKEASMNSAPGQLGAPLAGQGDPTILTQQGGVPVQGPGNQQGQIPGYQQVPFNTQQIPGYQQVPFNTQQIPGYQQVSALAGQQQNPFLQQQALAAQQNALLQHVQQALAAQQNPFLHQIMAGQQQNPFLQQQALAAQQNAVLQQALAAQISLLQEALASRVLFNAQQIPGFQQVPSIHPGQLAELVAVNQLIAGLQQVPNYVPAVAGLQQGLGSAASIPNWGGGRPWGPPWGDPWTSLIGGNVVPQQVLGQRASHVHALAGLGLLGLPGNVFQPVNN